MDYLDDRDGSCKLAICIWRPRTLNHMLRVYGTVQLWGSVFTCDELACGFT